MIFGGRVLWLLCACAAVSADKWRFPDDADASESVRIDSKVRFVDQDEQRGHHNSGNVQADEQAFEPATNTAGFYNRPANAPGRYPVRVEDYSHIKLRETKHKLPPQPLLENVAPYCKCLPTPECNAAAGPSKACGDNQYLCCYKRPNKNGHLNSEVFNEIEDERPELHPGHSVLNGPFPPPPDSAMNSYFGPGHGHEMAVLGVADSQKPQQPVLVGPSGPTGIIGPPQKSRRLLLQPDRNYDPAVIQNPAVLVGPGGPTGIIGPANNFPNKPPRPSHDLREDESAQRGVLVGPGGPTGIIGPGGYTGRPVLVGPGGPTGVIGPYGFNRPRNPGVLVGPGGPTGVIGPGRGLLVGPGGPTGQIGPRRPYFFESRRECSRSPVHTEALPPETVTLPSKSNKKRTENIAVFNYTVQTSI